MITRRELLSIYWNLRGAIVPALRSSQSFYEEHLCSRVDAQTRWLDLGCGRRVLPPWRAEQERRLVASCRSVVGLDRDLASLETHRTIVRRVMGAVGSLPFRDDCFDLVTMNMVMEHLDHPAAEMREIHRVLAPGGIFLFHTPNWVSYPVLAARCVPHRFRARIVRLLDGRRGDEVFRTYYRANTPRRIGRLARESGFRVLGMRMVTTDAVFAIVPPLCVVELLVIRALMSRPLRAWRTNIIGLCQKPVLGLAS